MKSGTIYSKIVKEWRLGEIVVGVRIVNRTSMSSILLLNYNIDDI